MANFFSIVPRDNNADLVDVDKPIPLRVVMEDGVELEPDIEFKNIELQGPYDMFKNNSGYNDSFDVTIVLHKDDMVTLNYERKLTDKGTEIDWDIFEKLFLKSMGEDKSTTGGEFDARVIDALDYWIRKGVPFYIHTNALGISKKALWLVTEQKKRTQNYNDGYVFWEVTFTRYHEIKAQTFNKITKVMEKAFKKAKGSTTLEKRKAAAKALSKCDRKKLVYSKKKKVVDCVKKLQQVLYLHGFLKKDQIDGWYGKTTKEAVKKYQKKYSKDYGLKVTGHVNAHTWQVMIGKGKKITTKSTKSIVNVNVDSNYLNKQVNDLGKYNAVTVNPKKVTTNTVPKTNVVSLKNAKKVSTKSSKNNKKTK